MRYRVSITTEGGEERVSEHVALSATGAIRRAVRDWFGSDATFLEMPNLIGGHGYRIGFAAEARVEMMRTTHDPISDRIAISVRDLDSSPARISSSRGALLEPETYFTRFELIDHLLDRAEGGMEAFLTGFVASRPNWFSARMSVDEEMGIMMFPQDPEAFCLDGRPMNISQADAGLDDEDWRIVAAFREELLGYAQDAFYQYREQLEEGTERKPIWINLFPVDCTRTMLF